MEYGSDKVATPKCPSAHRRLDDDDLLNIVLAALASRDGDTSSAAAVADALIDQLRRQPQRTAEVLGWRGSPDESPEVGPNPLRRWSYVEDRVTEALALEAGKPATAAMRFHAIELVGLVRCIGSAERWAHIDPIDHRHIDNFAQHIHNIARGIGNPVGG